MKGFDTEGFPRDAVRPAFGKLSNRLARKHHHDMNYARNSLKRAFVHLKDGHFGKVHETILDVDWESDNW